MEIDGREVNGCGYDRGMVFQHAELLPWRTAIENIEFGLELKGVRRTSAAPSPTRCSISWA